jgi:hypothetical protein
VLRAAIDLKTAKDDFDLLDRSVGGDHGFPREHCLRLLARAAIRSATGQYGAAEASASNAGAVAAGSALPHLAAYARQCESRYRRAAGEGSAPAVATPARHEPHARNGYLTLPSLAWSGIAP